MVKTIRSRANKSVNDTLMDKWKIVAKRVIAEPTPRTRLEPPRLGIYDPHLPDDVVGGLQILKRAGDFVGDNQFNLREDKKAKDVRRE